MTYEKANLQLKVADIKFEIETFENDVFYKQARNYAADFDKADFYIKVDVIDGEITPPKGKKLTDRSIENWFLTDEGKYVLLVESDYEERYIASAEVDTTSCKAYVKLLDIKKQYGAEPICFVHNILEMVIHFVIIHYNGFVVHASSIAYKGTGLAFSAESGTGKSTHTALWLKNCPDDTVMLNDDKPIFRYFENDGWYIYGTPWAGTTGLNTNLKVPLKALVFLERSRTNSIRRLASAEVISRFFEAVISPMSDEITDKILELLGLLIEKSNVCLLKCNMENEAMETVKKFLYE